MCRIWKNGIRWNSFRGRNKDTDEKELIGRWGGGYECIEDTECIEERFQRRIHTTQAWLKCSKVVKALKDNSGVWT